MRANLSVGALAGAVSLAAIAAPDNGKAVWLELRDGSQLRAEAREGLTLEIETRYGACKVPLADVRKLNLSLDGSNDEIRARRMVMVGSVRNAELELRNEYIGTFTLAREAVKELRPEPSPDVFVGTWRGQARDAPGRGGSSDDVTLEIDGLGADGLATVMVTGEFVGDTRTEMRDGQFKKGQLVFQMRARDGQVLVRLWPDPEDADKLKGEAEAQDEKADDRVFSLKRVGEGIRGVDLEDRRRPRR